ncbi:1,4-alpha-glucan branching protein domain-containing protein [Alkalihalobacillus sp. TS-13]|uniref:1,4-alpha-glucan branching protein domain-containing protein n=1 Tax=Alkalihalobacillus sp. TS-13 TaxID=2842455 RepID=UPI001C869324|nr:1,4-alpha-glucan branching protein domain-containing protein [Alkalihalobacillus sp. TS-13]
MNSYFSLVLHAHLPFVLHREPNRIEERWLFEAVSESYIPLIWGLDSSSPGSKYTISLSPPLLEMLASSIFHERYLTHIRTTQELLIKEREHATTSEEIRIIEFYISRFKKIKETFLEWNGDLISAFRFFMRENKIECITSSATHAILPYIQTEQGIRSQIRSGLDCFEQHFGFKPDGFWLPECAFSPGIDKLLYEEGVRYTFVEEATIRKLDPEAQSFDAPVFSPHGIVLFPRSSSISKKVWDAKLGYPGDYDYREFYRDIAYDRGLEYIAPYIHPDRIRIDTGLKYHRITGETDNKDYYDRENAMVKAKRHSEDFIQAVCENLNQYKGDKAKVTLAAFDAELFGHWWFEGPEWLEMVMKDENTNIHWITPKEFTLRHYQELTTHHACFSTWGRNGYGEVWLNESNAWIYRHLHAMEQELIKQMTILKDPDSLIRRALNQLNREWLLATASDWAFIMDQQSASEYAISRMKEHVSAFYEIVERLEEKRLSESFLQEMEERYPFFQWQQAQRLSSQHDEYISTKSSSKTDDHNLRILMLSWEYPPMVVGGLARHVFDLSRTLVKQGHQVCVITCGVEGYPEYEINQGVHVYRVNGVQPQHDDFYHWAGSLNLAIAKLGVQLASQIPFDCIHAHDWIVSVAAKGLKQQLDIPLYTTIHATEHGRNKGIHNNQQAEIHHKEWELMYESEHIIVCSAYMEQELRAVFRVPDDKITMIPNGVENSLIETKSQFENWKDRFGGPSCFYVFSLGRMVPEKGYQTLIEAAALLKNKYPEIKFIIAGKGPMLEEYRRRVVHEGLSDQVHLVGFISDEQRNQYLQEADALIFPSHYEPFGIVALEGMAAGTPVIVSDTGGLSDIIQHGENGLKVYPGDTQSIYDQIIRLYNEPDLVHRIVRKAQKDIVTKYCWEEIATNTVDVLSNFQKKLMMAGVK